MLHKRFREHTNRLFVKHGMMIIGFWHPTNKPNALIYLMAYKDRAARDASWAAFQADPEWAKVRTDLNVGVTVDAIMQANGIPDRNRVLRIGERLNIPDAAPGSPVPR